MAQSLETTVLVTQAGRTPLPFSLLLGEDQILAPSDFQRTVFTLTSGENRPLRQDPEDS